VVSLEEPQEVTDDLLASIGRLVAQLSSSSAPPVWADLETIVTSPATTLIVARNDDQMVGMLTLALFRIPTGVRAWIEDVVVDSSARGQGVGEALSRRALELAAQAGARTVELTSRPSRQAANRLYRRIGFQIRETNVYRYQHDPPAGG
jgi:ribosomal protein S18 acetylase RimI-like enzyme